MLFKGASTASGEAGSPPAALPLDGQKLQVNTEWGRDGTE
jgi:hypothetical protein